MRLLTLSYLIMKNSVIVTCMNFFYQPVTQRLSKLVNDYFSDREILPRGQPNPDRSEIVGFQTIIGNENITSMHIYISMFIVPFKA